MSLIVAEANAGSIMFTLVIFLNVLLLIDKSTSADIEKTMANEQNKSYTVLISDKTAEKISAYKQDLIKGKNHAGKYLMEILDAKLLSEITDEAFLQEILATKKPRIFAESQIRGSGMDWNNQELGILGDVNIAVPVTVYDNMGRGAKIAVYEKPFKAELLYSPGCLLRGDYFIGGSIALPDYMEVVKDGKIDQSAYNQLVARRIFPLLKYANEQSTIEEKAIINIPGLGCGQFAGEFRGKIGRHLDIALKSSLETYSKDLPNIALVRFDPYSECREYQGTEEHYGSITYRVRSLLDNPGKTQLCPPTAYQENNDDFSQCKLFKIVAWDHVSLPGNDFWGGFRETDDGIAAAATDLMNAFTTVKGYYNNSINKFVMPDGSVKWKEKAQPLTATNNLAVVSLG